MRQPSEKEITTALQENAESWANGRWHFGGGVSHSTAEARAIVRDCLILGTPVTDVLSSKTWSALVDRVLALEIAVTWLGGFPPGSEP